MLRIFHLKLIIQNIDLAKVETIIILITDYIIINEFKLNSLIQKLSASTRTIGYPHASQQLRINNVLSIWE